MRVTRNKIKYLNTKIEKGSLGSNCTFPLLLLLLFTCGLLCLCAAEDIKGVVHGL